MKCADIREIPRPSAMPPASRPMPPAKACSLSGLSPGSVLPSAVATHRWKAPAGPLGGVSTTAAETRANSTASTSPVGVVR